VWFDLEDGEECPVWLDMMREDGRDRRTLKAHPNGNFTKFPITAHFGPVRIT
jgi:hypothetical protein